MERSEQPTGRRNARGQILVLTATMMVVLIGMAALAIDVSVAYLTERWERTVADAAALSGAQSLQKPGTRTLPGPVEKAAAQANAMRILTGQLGGSPGVGDCYASTGCALTGTPYHVSVQTPSPSCVRCDGRRAVQVSIWQPQFGLTFGRIFGGSSWTVRATSVAGMVIAPQYGIVTLRPSALRPNDSDAHADDLVVTGGSKVIVGNADIATNSNAMCSGFSSGSEIKIETAAGFDLHHYGAGAAWVSGSGRCLNPPPGFQVTTLIEDPKYTLPTRTGAPVFATLADAKAAVPASDCLAQQLLVPSEYIERKTLKQVNDASVVTAECYKPGIYQEKLTVSDPASGNPKVVLLLPGVYFFDAGVDVASTLLGGYTPNQPGITAVFKEAHTSSGIPGRFTTSSTTSLVALNFGTRYCPGTTCPTGSWAAPAVGFDGTEVKTPGPRPSLITVMVEPDASCVVVSPPPLACDEAKNSTLSLTGRGNVFLAGVQYAPSDNAVLTGGSGQASDVGAMWVWTVSFNGGSMFNLASDNPQSSGILRLDPACTIGEECFP